MSYSNMMYLFVILLYVSNSAVLGKYFDSDEHIEESSSLRYPKKLVHRGTTVDIQKYPHQVSLELKGLFWCGGSIISEDFILTAAHCTYNTVPREWKVRAGSNFVYKGGATYNVTVLINHPYFDVFSGMDYDIALMKTSHRMSYNNYMKPVRLAAPDGELGIGERIKVTGWGSTTGKKGDVAKKLQAATLYVVNQALCQIDWWLKDVHISERMFCGEVDHFGGKDCYGDSGGAVIGEKDWVQYGIVSFGYGNICGESDIPNVYTNVAKLRGWIRDVTRV